MENNIIWTCTYCNIVPSTQSSRKCSHCGRKLTACNLSKTPLERQPEWPTNKYEVRTSAEKDENYIDYTKFYHKNGD